MYEFYYHRLQPYYDSKIKLHYMDTDSFILSIKTKDLIKDVEYFKDDFDFSELNKSHDINNPINKKVIGKMKIETSPVIELDNFVALRSESYAYSSFKKKIRNKKESKSLPRRKVFNSLFNFQTTTATKDSIRSDAHNLTVQKQDNLSLNPFDNKRM